MTKRESLILTLAGSLATAGVGRYEEHYARAERLVDEVLTEHAHELAEKIREANRAVSFSSAFYVGTGMDDAANLIDPEVT